MNTPLTAPAGPLRIALLVADARADKELAAWFQGAEGVSLVEPGAWPEADILVVDPTCLMRHRERIAERRHGERPRLLPVLLLASTPSFPTELEHLVDDVITVPVNPTALRFRVRVACRMRQLSLDLDEKIHFERHLAGVVGHDMRTPIATLGMCAELLKLAGERTGDQAAGLAGRIERAVTTLGGLAEDLLVIAQSRSTGTISVAPQQLDVWRVIEDAVQGLPIFERIQVVRTGSAEAALDPVRLRQAVTNLLQNALKHSPVGTPVVLRVDGTDSEALVIEIENHGSLDEADPRALFRAFAQGHSATGNGVGLGLYVVDAIVRAHGGTLDIVEREARVVFAMAFPRHPPDADGPRGEPASA